MKRNTAGKARGMILGLAVSVLVCGIAWISPAEKTPQQGKLFSFGVMADVQYADKDTTGARHYRDSFDNLEKCVAELNKHDLAFTIQLGDFIDGNETPEKTHADFERVLAAYNRLTMPKFHVVGNHCLHAGTETLQRELGLESFFYDFTVPEAKGFRFIVLDGNDAGYGVLGEEQLAWLKERLMSACENGERVIMFNHFPLLEAAAAHHRMANPEPVLALMDEAGCVEAYFAGHDHAGGYAVRNGVQHVTLRGIVEAPAENSFAVIEVYPTGLREIGFGAEPSRDLGAGIPLPKKDGAPELSPR